MEPKMEKAVIIEERFVLGVQVFGCISQNIAINKHMI